MTRNGTRAAIMATACVLTIAAIFASVTARPVGGGRDYAILSLSESYADREAIAVLSSAGIDGIVSESTQWIYIDSFGGMERVFLDRYRDRLESFDPRDDGYADRLRPLFVSEGRRRLFVPDASASRLRVVDALFAEVDHTLEAPPRSAAALGDLVLCTLAILVALFVCGVPAVFVAAAPALISLACFGPAGLAASALLAASLRSAVEPAREALRAGRGAARLRERPWLLDGLFPAILFGGGAIAASVLGGIPVLPALLCLAAGFTSVLAAIDFLEILRVERGHARFTPVNLDYRFARTFSASRTAAPFVVVALISFVISFSGLGSTGGATPSPAAYPSITADQYREHIEFQKTFSVSRLASASGPYGRYRLEADGLVAGGMEQDHSGDTGKLELPPAERMLTRKTAVSGSPGGSAYPVMGTLVALIAALAAASPAAAHLVRQRARSKGVESLADKRIAA